MGLDISLGALPEGVTLNDIVEAEEANERITENVYQEVRAKPGFTEEREKKSFLRENAPVEMATVLTAEGRAEVGRLKAMRQRPLPGGGFIRIPETAVPGYEEHLFKLGYLRSSYNGGGINNILRNTIGKDLYYIFRGEDDSGEEYYRLIDWPAALVKCQEVLAEYKAFVEETGDISIEFFACETAVPIAPKAGDPPTNNIFIALAAARVNQDKEQGVEHPSEEVAVRDIYKTHLERYKAKDKSDTFSGYSSREGHFMLDNPMKVRALVSGNRWGRPGIWAVVERESNEDEASWYVQALEVTLKNIEWVLSKDDPSRYFLRWSG